MKKNLLLAALGLAVSGAAFADAKSFEGYNAGLNLNLTNSSSKLGGIGGEGLELGGNSTVAALQGGYTFAMGSNATFGVQASYTLGDTKFGNFGDGSLKGKDAFSLAFEPGYAVSKDALLFGTLSYNRTKLKDSGPDATSENFSGLGYGAGARIKLDRNVYVQIQAIVIDYKEKSEEGFSLKPRSTVGSIGIGYKF